MLRTSCSSVDLSSLEAVRNSTSPLPSDVPNSGSFFGPKIIKATTKIMINSGTPIDPILSSNRNHVELLASKQNRTRPLGPRPVRPSVAVWQNPNHSVTLQNCPAVQNAHTSKPQQAFDQKAKALQDNLNRFLAALVFQDHRMSVILSILALLTDFLPSLLHDQILATRGGADDSHLASAQARIQGSQKKKLRGKDYSARTEVRTEQYKPIISIRKAEVTGADLLDSCRSSRGFCRLALSENECGL